MEASVKALVCIACSLYLGACAKPKEHENRVPILYPDSALRQEGSKTLAQVPVLADSAPESGDIQIIDYFLYEDKYYLKLRFLEPVGEVSVSLTEENKYSLTQLNDHTFQLIIYDALDMEEATLLVSSTLTGKTNPPREHLLSHRLNKF